MLHDELPKVSLHNVSAVKEAAWDTNAQQLLRVPPSTINEVNIVARERFHHPTGCEVRFVPETDEPIKVTLSAPSSERVRVFWGDFQSQLYFEISSTPTTVEFPRPDTFEDLKVKTIRSRFDPGVCRVRFEGDAPVAVHDVTGSCRPPTINELPSQQYLAYGTSITEGAAATAIHLSYVSRVARYLGVDPLNLGCSGSAFCDPAVADHIARRDDWDIASLSVSVNMANRGFTVDQFRDRAETLVETVTRSHPEKPIVAVTLFPYHADLQRDGDAERAQMFRTALHETVAACPQGDLRTIDGRDAMAPTGLTTDLLHPSDAGMASIAERVANAFKSPERSA